jgi:hypothetical protein
MKPQLFTVHGLAVELQMTERAVAARLRTVPPDGRIGRHEAYFLATVLAAERPTARNGGSRRSPLLEVLCDRVSGEAPARTSPPLAIDEVAELMDVPSTDVLVWLRAGCPFVKAR